VFVPHIYILTGASLHMLTHLFDDAQYIDLRCQSADWPAKCVCVCV